MLTQRYPAEITEKYMPGITRCTRITLGGETTHPLGDKFQTRFSPKHALRGPHTTKNGGSGKNSSRRLHRRIAQRFQYALPFVDEPGFEYRPSVCVILLCIALVGVSRETHTL